MIAGKLSALRPNARSTNRYLRPSLLARSIGKRSYASLQERVGQSSDTPWRIAAVAVTVPGLLYLRSSGGTAEARHAEEVYARQSKPAEKEYNSAASIMSEATTKMKEGIQKTQNTISEKASTVETEGASASSSSSSATAHGAQTNRAPETS
ncbi:hypothetical protein VTI28DRAFT_3454 [Corynascus sepedonium]